MGREMLRFACRKSLSNVEVNSLFPAESDRMFSYNILEWKAVS